MPVWLSSSLLGNLVDSSLAGITTQALFVVKRVLLMEWAMKCRYYSGDPDKPLLMAYHGTGQKSVGLFSWLPWYWSFPHMSQLLATCEELRWSCCMPQASGIVFRVDEGPAQILRARQLTGSSGPLVLFGFSMGAESVHELANYLTKTLLGEDFYPRGIWAHSGRAPTIADLTSYRKYKVLVTCNKEEVNPLPFNQGRSMRDERITAEKYYEVRGFKVRSAEGSSHGEKPPHRCDPSLNKRLLQWMIA